jgi:hypothetical protein
MTGTGTGTMNAHPANQDDHPDCSSTCLTDVRDHTLKIEQQNSVIVIDDSCQAAMPLDGFSQGGRSLGL